MSVAEVTRLTPDDLLALPDDGRTYELVDGELLELQISGESSWIAGQILVRLNPFITPMKRGWLFSVDAGFRCFPDAPDMVRKPDVAFVSRERLPVVSPTGYIQVAPNLAVEVISPHDVAYEIEAKVQMWLEAGCEIVWTVMPRSRTVTVHQQTQGPVILTANQTLAHPELLPGFECLVSDI
ncbi:MAG: Uma2 family endonuclease, partial [Planctomycetaceae bacterium]